MTETGWYKGTQKPVMVGIYKRHFRFEQHVFYCWWDGQEWSVGDISIKRA